MAASSGMFSNQGVFTCKDHGPSRCDRVIMYHDQVKLSQCFQSLSRRDTAKPSNIRKRDSARRMAIFRYRLIKHYSRIFMPSALFCTLMRGLARHSGVCQPGAKDA